MGFRDLKKGNELQTLVEAGRTSCVAQKYRRYHDVSVSNGRDHSIDLYHAETEACNIH
jgi:hypothetical protein